MHFKHHLCTLGLASLITFLIKSKDYFLYRTTTLDDIQNQLINAAKHLKSNQNPLRRKIMTPVSTPILMAYDEKEDEDSGDITGYAYKSSRNDSKNVNVSKEYQLSK